MCGRGTQEYSWKELHNMFGIMPTGQDPETLKPNYNVAPTHDVVICTESGDGRRIEKMRWGLIPIWAKEPPKFSTFNAKCESIEEKATWKGSLNKMRCVIPFNGFYEWKGPKGNKQPYYVSRADGAPMLIAGLWAYNDKIDPDGVRSFAIITCPNNSVMGLLHSRMPVILDQDGADLWLAPGNWSEAQKSLLKPCPDDWITAVPVSRDVGAVRNNRPGLTDPIDEPIF